MTIFVSILRNNFNFIERLGNNTELYCSGITDMYYAYKMDDVNFLD